MNLLNRAALALFLLLALFTAPLNVIAASSGDHVQQSRSERVEKVVYLTRTGRKYHRADCRHLRYSAYPVSKREAVERGYGACKVCRP